METSVRSDCRAAMHALGLSLWILLAACDDPAIRKADDDHLATRDAQIDGATASGSRDGAATGGAGLIDSGVALRDASAGGSDGRMSCTQSCPNPDNSWCDPTVGECVPCAEAAHCGGFQDTAPVCKVGAGCVACTDDPNGDELCKKDNKVCKEGANVCVECNVTGDCDATSEKPICASHSCRGCQADAECAGGGTCDEPTGRCVECTPDKESEQCTNGKACDPFKRTCTGAVRGVIGVCGHCVADSECLADHRCVPMVFGPGNLSQGGRCLKLASSGCSAPYGAAPIHRASLSGAAPSDYCGISEAMTSCDAIKALENHVSCPGGNGGLCGGAGALCASVNGVPNSCTYGCSSNAECPSTPCGGYDGKYCGGPAD